MWFQNARFCQSDFDPPLNSPTTAVCVFFRQWTCVWQRSSKYIDRLGEAPIFYNWRLPELWNSLIGGWSQYQYRNYRWWRMGDEVYREFEYRHHGFRQYWSGEINTRWRISCRPGERAMLGGSIFAKKENWIEEFSLSRFACICSMAPGNEGEGKSLRPETNRKQGIGGLIHITYVNIFWREFQFNWS